MATIDKTYHKLLQKIMDEGFDYDDPNRKGTRRRQITSFEFRHKFEDGFPAITTKKLWLKGVVGELIWFLRGDTNIKYLVDNDINIWNKDAYNYFLKDAPQLTESRGGGKFEKVFFERDNELHFDLFLGVILSGEDGLGDLGRVYGAQWRSWTNYDLQFGGFGEFSNSPVDQIRNLIHGLRNTPMATNHIVTAWNPAELGDMALPPCHWSFEVLVEPTTEKDKTKYLEVHNTDLGFPKHKFTLKWNQRSVDTFLGLPFNIASYAILAHIIGAYADMLPYEIIGNLSNVHVYDNHFDAVKELLSRDVNKFDNSELDIDPKTIKVNSWIYKGDLDKFLSSLEISQFRLSNYQSYPKIEAEMLAYKK